MADVQSSFAASTKEYPLCQKAYCARREKTSIYLPIATYTLLQLDRLKVIIDVLYPMSLAA